MSLRTSSKLMMANGALLMNGAALIGLAVSSPVAIALFCIMSSARQMLSLTLLKLIGTTMLFSLAPGRRVPLAAEAL